MNPHIRKAAEFTDRSSSYVFNSYGFDDRAISELARNGISARSRLMEACNLINEFADEITHLNNRIVNLSAKVSRLVELCDNNAIPREDIDRAEKGPTK